MARQRLEGIIEFSSPDKSWADNSAWPAPPLTSKPSHCSSAICCCSYLVRKEKQKLLAPIDHPTPATFQSFENNPMQLPVAQAQPCSAATMARAFAAAVPAPALLQAALPRALGRLPDGGQLVGR